MRRRDFITLLGGAAVACPLAARSQQRERVRRIGVLIGVADDAETKGWVAILRKRLDELGWRAGDNLQIEERWTAGDPDRNRRFAGELLAVKPRRPSLQSTNRALCGRVLPASIRSRGPVIRRTGDRGRRAPDRRDRSGNRRHGS